MNCKPGDLAVIVTAFGFSALEKFVGYMVEVKRPAGHRHPFGAMWEVEHWDVLRVADACLRPIRDPGDDATDETLLWLPVPSRQKETA